MLGEGGQPTVGSLEPAEESPLSVRKWVAEATGREPWQGRRNDTVPIQCDDPSVGEVFRGFDETATPHWSKLKLPDRYLIAGG